MKKAKAADDYVTVTDLYFPHDNGKVTHVRMIGGQVLSVDNDAPVVFLDPLPLQYIEQETLESCKAIALIYPGIL